MPNRDSELSRPIKVAQVAPNIFPVPPHNHGGTERVIHDLSVGLQELGCAVTLFAPSDSTCPCRRSARCRACSTWKTSTERCLRHPIRTRSGADGGAATGHGCVRHPSLPWRILPCGPAWSAPPNLADDHPLAGGRARPGVVFRGFPDLPVAAISQAQEAGAACFEPRRRGPPWRRPDPFRTEREPTTYLAFIGRMTDQKRPDVAIRVAKAGRPADPAGRHDRRRQPALFRHYVRPQLSGEAEYIGPVDDAAKNLLLRDASALLFSDRLAEPFGLVMIEAMACGTPVIAWNGGSVSEVVEHGVTGFIVDSEDEAHCRDRQARTARSPPRACQVRSAVHGAAHGAGLSRPL